MIVPHAGYVYSGTTAALAYALLERGRGTIKRAVIVGPTHRVAVHGVAASSAGAFATPLDVVPVDVAAERGAIGVVEDQSLRSGMVAATGAPAPAMIVNDPTHAREYAVEVQIPFLQTVLGADLSIVPLNVGDAKPSEVGDALRALWGGPETVIASAPICRITIRMRWRACWTMKPSPTFLPCTRRYVRAVPAAHIPSMVYWM